jgi:hypothetical protein
LTIAGPRAVETAVFETRPIFVENASSANCGLAPMPGTGSPRATHGVVLKVTMSFWSFRISSSDGSESFCTFSTRSRASRLTSASVLRWVRSAPSAPRASSKVCTCSGVFDASLMTW